MKRFEEFGHSADVGLTAYGKSPEELFENAAFGMFSLMTDLKKVGTAVSRELAITAEERETLLVNWLNELLFIHDTGKLIFSEFKVSSLTPKALAARVSGEKIDLARHKIDVQIKAATFNQLSIRSEKGKWLGRVIFDI